MIKNLVFGMFCLCVSMGASAAETLHDDDHANVSNRLPLASLLTRVWSLHQPDQLLNAQQQWLANQEQLVDGVLSGQARVIGEFKSDKAGRDIGYQNMSLGLSLPLWWPSEHRLAQETVQSLRQWQQLQLQAQRQLLALSFYRASETYFSARESLHHAELAVNHAQELYDHVKLRVEQGDLSAFDLVSTQADLLQRQQAVLSAQQDFNAEQASYQQLTGQSELPIVPKKPVSFAQKLELSHVSQWVAAHNELNFIHAQLLQSEQASAEKPELTVTAEQDTLDRYAPSNGIARIGISLPLGVGAYREQRSRQLAWEAAQAQVRLEQLVRVLTNQWSQLVFSFKQSQQQLQHQTVLNQSLSAQYTMAQSAFRSGELDLRELLRIKSAWLEGQHTYELLVYQNIFSALMLQQLQDIPS